MGENNLLTNQANIFSTNIFETLIGAINLAPIKVSGQYKIVVDLNNDLYLDDYTGRRVKLNKSEKFLPQVASFLKTSTLLNSNDNLKYGAFQKSTKKYYHIPFYLGSNSYDKKYPNYFLLNRVVNENITDISYLYKYGKILQIHNLNKLGIHKIFDEIIAEDYYEYPLYFNWEDGFIEIHGYDIYQNTPAVKTIKLLNSQSNQPYIDVLNNTILNAFVNNGIIFPKFLNFEFEFEYENNYAFFNNFYGYLSFGKEISKAEINPAKFTFKYKDFIEKDFEWTQQLSTDEINLSEYIDIAARGVIQEINEKNSQIRLKLYKIDVNDSIKILQQDNEIEFEYVVKVSDIVKTSFYRTLLNICREATNLSGSKFTFSITQNTDTTSKSNSRYILKIVWNDINIYNEDFKISVPSHIQILDRFNSTDSNYFEFRGISNQDVSIPGQPTLIDSIDTILIENKFYNIIDKFKFDDRTIIRLDKPPYIDKLTNMELFINKTEKLIEAEPIPFLLINSNFKSYLPFEQEKYVQNLIETFVTNGTITEDIVLANQSIEKFNSRKSYALNQYIKDNLETGEIEDTDILEIVDSNSEKVLNMFFSNGTTTYLTPNILNIEKQFYVQNGCVDIAQLTNDLNRYYWFLIKGKCPDYLKNDIRGLRYFETEPKITSRLVKVSDTICECVFLGVKYQLPIKYENFKFAVYLNFNNKLDINTYYEFDVNRENRTLFLSINKYLDFSDLLRGGNTNSEPLLDLSFFHNVTESFNTNSENFENFKTSGIYIRPELNGQSVFFGTELWNDWKKFHDGKWYILLKNENTGDSNDFKLLFPNAGDSKLYVYSTIEYNGKKYAYISMIIIVKGIKYIESDYLWCEDILVNFYDTKKIFLYRFNDVTNVDEVLYVDKSSIFDLTAKSGEAFGDMVQVGTIMINGQNERFELLLPDKILSFKEYWFEITHEVSRDQFNTPQETLTVEKFPEFFLNHLTDIELLHIFDSNPDNSSDYKINLFNKNQIWQTIRDIVRVDLKFKEMFETQVKKYLNEFMVTNLIDYSDINAVKISGTLDEYINFNVVDVDRNIAIWNILNEKKLILLNRYSSFYYPFLPIAKDEIDFQLPKFKSSNSLFNIYDDNFGGNGITATGLWSEVSGNLISSLFCYAEDITLTASTEKSNINFKLLLNQFFTANSCIINSKNTEYIQKINKNVDEYIVDKFTEYILNNFYKLDSVIDSNGNKIVYQIDSKNKYMINFDNTKPTLGKNITFIFKRK